MSSYAVSTSVSPEKSIEEIKGTLRRFGATSFSYHESTMPPMAALEFDMNNRRVRFVIAMPKREEFLKTDRGRPRNKNQTDLEWEKSGRQKWRSLALIVKAKLVAVDESVVEFDQEFAMHFVMTNGQTVYEQMKPRMDEICDAKNFPALMPGA